MGNVSDEMLTLAMVVADGEASLADERKLQAALVANPALARQVAAFTATGRRGLGRVFDEVMAAPVPDHLERTVMTAPMARMNGQSAQVITTLGARWRDLMASWQAPALVFGAAALAFIAGGLLLGRSDYTGPQASQVAALGSFAPSAGLTEALTKVATGAAQKLDTKSGVLDVRMVETFRNQSGAPCREFEAQAATGPAQFGVACHETNGWQLKAVFEGPVRTNLMVPVGAGDYSDMLDGLVGKMRKEALSAADEAKLIGGGW